MSQALLLDRNYMALRVIGWKKAVNLLVTGKAESVGDILTKTVGTIAGDFGVPSILRLVTVIPFKAHIGRLRFSVKNVYIRDEHKCQFCERHLGKNTATIDHIIPRSRGGNTSYENCVACCKPCNNKKGDKKPSEVGMLLLRKPKKPTFLVLYKHYMQGTPDEWSDYIIGV